MTQGRMIRLDDGLTTIIFVYKNGLNLGIDVSDSLFVEPAPPKDWRPLCYKEDCICRNSIAKNCPYHKGRTREDIMREV